MDAKSFSNAVREAAEMAMDVVEPYKAAAFQVALSFILARHDAGEGSSTSPETVPARRMSSESFEEFAAQLPRSITSHNDRFVAVAYYVAQHFDGKQFRASDVAEQYFRRVGWPRPRNSYDVAIKCAKKGHFRLSGTDDAGVNLWSVTQLGIKYFEQLMADKIEK